MRARQPSAQPAVRPSDHTGAPRHRAAGRPSFLGRSDRPRRGTALAAVIALVLLAWSPAFAANSPLGDTAAPWPAAWNTYDFTSGAPVVDVTGDENPPGQDLSGGACGTNCTGTSPTVLYTSNGTTAFFRVRLSANNADASKGGLFGGAFLTQIAVGGTVRAVVGVDGKTSSADYVYVTNAVGSATTTIYQWPFDTTGGADSRGMRVVDALDGTFYLDYQVPIARITAASGGTITAATPIQLFYGSSAAANLATINKDYMTGSTVSFTNLATVSLTPAALTTSSSLAHVTGSNPPATNQTTRYTATVTATNPGGGALGDVTLAVPVPATGTVVARSTTAGTLSGSGTGTTWSLGTLAAGATRTATFTIDVRPPTGSTGTQLTVVDTVTGTGRDAPNAVDRTASSAALTVGPVQFSNGTPTAADDTATVTEDSLVDLDVLANDSDPDGETLTATVGAPSHGTTSLLADGRVRYEPAPNFHGTDSFTYQACDGSGACATATVTVTVSPVNDPPTAADGAFSTPEDVTATYDLAPLVGDADGDTLTWTLGTPGHGTATLAGTELTYVPSPDYAGPESVTYTVCDPAGACATGTLTVTVTPVNDAPVAAAGLIATAEDTAGSLDLAVLASDVEGDALTFTSGTASNGTVALVGSVLTYTPDAGFAGTDTVTYTVCDPDGACATATVTVTVTAAPPVNAPPTVQDDTATVDEDGQVDVDVLANDTDPEGAALTVTLTGAPSDGTVELLAGGGVRYHPTDGFHGTDSFTYEACDPQGLCGAGTVTVTVASVNDVPQAVDTTATTPEDTPVAVDLAPFASDEDGDVLTFAVAPAGHGTTTVVGSVVTYTPAPDYHGPHVVSWTVCDPDGACDTATLTITVTPENDTPTAAAGAMTTSEDVAASLDLALLVADVDGDPLTLTPGTPAHGTVQLVGTVVTYTPDADWSGTDTFDYEVCDPDGSCVTATVTVTVEPVDDAPVASDVSATTDEDVDVTVDLGAGASDQEGDALTFAVGTASHGTVTLTGSSALYSPEPGWSGTDQFTYTVCDPSGLCDTATVTVVVGPVNAPPTAQDATTGTVEDTAVVLDLSTSVADREGRPLTVGVTGASNGTVTVSGLEVTYVPAPGFVGTDTFTYEVCDPDGACVSATVTVTVTPVNDSPTATAGAVTTPEDTPVTVDLGTLTADPEGDALTFSLGAPQHGSVSLAGDVVTYTPDPDWSGVDTFTYEVCDAGGACVLSQVTVTVDPVDDAPVAVAASGRTDEDVDVAIDLTPAASDVDGGALTFAVGTPSHGTVTLTGALAVYTPEPGWSGTDEFTFTVCDGTGLCDTATVTVVVDPVNDVPQAADVAVSTDEDEAVTVDLAGSATDPDGDALTSTAAAAAHGTVTLAGSVLTYTPVADYAGADAVTYTVCDPAGECASATVTVTVVPVNDAPTAVDGAAVTTQDVPVTVDLAASVGDVEGDVLTFTVGTPQHGTVTLTGGVVQYTPAPGWSGTDTFTFTACDPDGACVTATVTVTVAPVDAPPTAADTTVQVAAGRAVVVDLASLLSDAQGRTWRLAVATASHGTVTLVGSEATYVPAAGFAGTDAFAYEACDDDDLCVGGVVTVLVAAETPAVPPVVPVPPAAVPTPAPPLPVAAPRDERLAATGGGERLAGLAVLLLVCGAAVSAAVRRARRRVAGLASS